MVAGSITNFSIDIFDCGVRGYVSAVQEDWQRLVDTFFTPL
jgi:hypothetical protein